MRTMYRERQSASPWHLLKVPAALGLVVLGLVTSITGCVLHFGIVSIAFAEPVQLPQTSTQAHVVKVVPKHIQTPPVVKAIYMSQCVVATSTMRDTLVSFIDHSDLNAVVIDIQDFTGTISYPAKNPLLHGAVSKTCAASDMAEFIATLHAKGIYVIGRITTFQNPHYGELHPEQAIQKLGGGVWHDYRGLAFVDVGAREYWGYVTVLAQESYDLGFDELNFDYERFPSDGPRQDAVYSYEVGKNKAEALEEFFAYLSAILRPRGMDVPDKNAPVLSADLFGMTTTNYDDLGIGQVLERALPYFDYIDPMVYPSHYPPGYRGFMHVDEHAYEIVKTAMDVAGQRAEAATTTVAALAHTRLATSSLQLYAKTAYPRSKIRPWLQSFDYPVHYTPAMVAAQIQATEDANIPSWIFWDASNKYLSLRQVLGD